MRTLVFVNNQVYFQCRQGIFGEDTTAEIGAFKPKQMREEMWGSLLPRALDDGESPDSAFQIFLMYYCRRELTNQSDATNAMRGILERLSSRMRRRLLEALPTSTFDAHILFDNSNGFLTRRCDFPSYSWSGWKGMVDWNAEDFEWDDL